MNAAWIFTQDIVVLEFSQKCFPAEIESRLERGGGLQHWLGLVGYIFRLALFKSQVTQQRRIIPAYPPTCSANRKSRVELLFNRREILCILWWAGSNWDAREIFMIFFEKQKSWIWSNMTWIVRYWICSKIKFTVGNPIVNDAKYGPNYMNDTHSLSFRLKNTMSKMFGQN